jgi:hypothetical protein
MSEETTNLHTVSIGKECDTGLPLEEIEDALLYVSRGSRGVVKAIRGAVLSAIGGRRLDGKHELQHFPNGSIRAICLGDPDGKGKCQFLEKRMVVNVATGKVEKDNLNSTMQPVVSLIVKGATEEGSKESIIVMNDMEDPPKTVRVRAEGGKIRTAEITVQVNTVGSRCKWARKPFPG